jgi:hypothetical protein
MKPEPKSNSGTFLGPFGWVLLAAVIVLPGGFAYLAYDSHQATIKAAAAEKLERDRHDAEEAAIEKDRHDAEEAVRTKALANQEIEEEAVDQLAAAEAAEEAAAAHRKAITENLRVIASAAQQYMLEHGVMYVSEEQLEEANYIKPPATVTGETYTELQIDSTTTQISVQEEDGRSTLVTFNL